ncbi:unnamed protein product [Knipowitschia caucasica]
METEAVGDHYHRVMAAQNSAPGSQNSAPGSYVESRARNMWGTDEERRKHQCPLCLKRFTSKQSLQNHSRVHTGEKPYSCSVCEKAFAKKFTLDAHMRIHTGERPYSCFICMRGFAQRSNWNAHMKTHNRNGNV